MNKDFLQSLTIIISAIAAISSIISVFVSFITNTKIEKIKSKFHKSSIAYEQLQIKRLDIVSEFYKKISKIDNMLMSMFTAKMIFDAKFENKKAQFELFDELFGDLIKYANENSIWFSEDLSSEINKMLVSFRDYSREIKLLIYTNKVSKKFTDNRDFLDKFTRDSVLLKNKIQIEFRKIMGVEGV